MSRASSRVRDDRGRAERDNSGRDHSYTLVYKTNGDTRYSYDVPAETTQDVNDFVVPTLSVIDEKGLVKRRSCTLATYVTPSLQPVGYGVVV